MPQRTKLIQSFTAADDQGKTYTLDVFQTLNDTGAGLVPRTSWIQARDGEQVDHIDRGKYRMHRILGADTILHSDDPKRLSRPPIASTPPL